MDLQELIETTKGMIESSKDSQKRVRTRASKRANRFALEYFESVLGVLEKQAKVDVDDRQSGSL